MDIARLRSILRPLIGDLKDACTNNTLPDLCVELSMPIPGDDYPSKRERIYASFDALPDENITYAVEQLLSRGLQDAGTRSRYKHYEQTN